VGAPILIADSITRVSSEARGAVVVNASHGGVYAAYLAARLGAAAAIFNDASVGLDRAGIGGLAYLQAIGIPAAAVNYDSARIGDGADTMRGGIVSFANALAEALGVRVGQSCSDAAAHLALAENPHRAAPGLLEATRLIEPSSPQVWAVDSAALVSADHRDAILVTGSHGGLLGNRPETALKHDVRAALFNDAGIGKDEAGISRLPALAARGIAAATVAAASARIGDARSTYDDGIISRVNAVAAGQGLSAGMTAREFVRRLRQTVLK
jgi:hypothetical protein